MANKSLFKRLMGIHRAVVFRRKSGFYGEVYTNSRNPIVINIGLHERRLPSRTYLHECLHILYPDMSERNIRALEEMTWDTMTAKQRFLLARKLYSREWRTK